LTDHFKALSQVKAEGAAEVRAILDENGNVTGYEEVPAPKAEPNDVQEVEEEVVTFDIESMGLSDEVLEEERKAAEEKQEATKREQDEFRKKFDEIQKLPEEERKAAQMKLLEESSTTVVEKPIPLPTTEEIVTIIPRA
jgi:molecular chaperone DnaK (HSP70)